MIVDSRTLAAAAPLHALRRRVAWTKVAIVVTSFAPFALLWTSSLWFRIEPRIDVVQRLHHAGREYAVIRWNPGACGSYSYEVQRDGVSLPGSKPYHDVSLRVRDGAVVAVYADGTSVRVD